VNVFVDTSAFLAVLNKNDQNHPPAKEAWQDLLSKETQLVTSNYVLVETIAILQHRFGLSAVRLFEGTIQPILSTLWVDQELHQRGMSTMLTANRRQLSLVDCINFEIIRQNHIEWVFALDPHFVEQGFSVIPDLGEVHT